jgi:hypothetical protein
MTPSGLRNFAVVLGLTPARLGVATATSRFEALRAKGEAGPGIRCAS